MTILRQALLVAAGLTAAATPAHANALWCKAVPSDRNADSVQQALLPDDPEHAFPAIVQVVCYSRSEEDRARVEAARQAWMHAMLMTEQDWVTDVVAWIAAGHERIGIGVSSHAAWSTLGPLDQWPALTSSVGWSTTNLYLADALPPTATGRAAFVRQCLDAPSEHFEVMAAICQPDLSALSPETIADEIRAAKDRAPSERLAVRIGFAGLVSRLPAYTKKVKEVLARDPVYGKIFELVKGAHKEWAANAASRTSLLALVLGLDDARATESRKAIAGCSERVWPAFTAAIGERTAKDFEIPAGGSKSTSPSTAAAGVILRDPTAYLAANALATCEDGRDPLARELNVALATWPGFRGPRTASLTAIVLADIKPDRRSEKIYIPEWRFDLGIRDDGGWKNPGKGDARGVIASIKQEGELIRITFPKQSGLFDRCAAERTTNRITRIDNHGNVSYETVCTSWTTERVDTTIPPVTVAKRYGAKLAPKRFVAASGGMVEGVWETAKSTRPLAIFGVALK